MTGKGVVHSLDDPLAQIVTVRGQKVILDADLARIYGVPTKALNQAVKRNRKKFPADFIFRLTLQEVAALRSQIVTSNDKPIRLQRIMEIIDPPALPQPPRKQIGFSASDSKPEAGNRVKEARAAFRTGRRGRQG
ncbi:MAG: ORF6N domain-containing protein [Candidatus Eisenbacteria bacterium]